MGKKESKSSEKEINSTKIITSSKVVVKKKDVKTNKNNETYDDKDSVKVTNKNINLTKKKIKPTDSGDSKEIITGSKLNQSPKKPKTSKKVTAKNVNAKTNSEKMSKTTKNKIAKTKKVNKRKTRKTKKVELDIDVLEHVLVPKHILLSENEVKKVFDEYGITFKNLPKIYLKDPALKNLNAKPGDVIKIIRKSPISGESIYFRGVIE